MLTATCLTGDRNFSERPLWRQVLRSRDKKSKRKKGVNTELQTRYQKVNKKWTSFSGISF